MKQKSLFWCLILVLTVVCAPLTAYSSIVAPPIILPATGQTTSYVPGDDGDLQMGVAWPSPRFQDNSDGTITDLLTGLMWAASSIGPATYINAMTAIDLPMNLGGQTDWRMPNILEMESLTNAGAPNSATWLNTMGFSVYDGIDGVYWVSNPYPWGNPPQNNGTGWGVMLKDGRMVTPDDGGFPFNLSTMSDSTPPGINTQPPWGTLNMYYLPVRIGPNGSPDLAYPANIRKTGRRTSYYANDDGVVRWGVDWNVSCYWSSAGGCVDGRFTDNGDSTMTDNLTGLMWLQDANCLATNYPGLDTGVVHNPGDGNVLWQTGLNFVAGINDGTYPLCSGGYTDWRMPNKNELRSLSMWAVGAGGVADMGTSYYLQDQGFLNTPNFGWRNHHWTSTAQPDMTDRAYAIRTVNYTTTMSDTFMRSDSTYWPTYNWPLAGGSKAGMIWPVRTNGGDDGDGVPVQVENKAPNFGDGNDDGIPDLIQPLVTSLPSAAGFVTVVTSGGGCTQNMNVQTAAASPADPGFSYPLGVAGFEILCSPGGTADMEIIFHGSSDLSGMVYRNYGSTGPAFGATEWYEMTGVTFGTRVIGGQTVATATFSITDDQLGDHNDLSDFILSLGGPALPAPPTAIPTMTQWGMVVFMLLAVAGAVYFIRRRRYNN